MSSIFINVEVDVHQLSREIVEQFSEDQCFELIRDLEASMARWEFLERLHKYFSAEVAKGNEE
jgi:hypothetical protein